MWYDKIEVKRVVLLDTSSGTAEKAASLGAKTVLLPIDNWPRRAIPSGVSAMAEATPTRPVRFAALEQDQRWLSSTVVSAGSTQHPVFMLILLSSGHALRASVTPVPAP